MDTLVFAWLGALALYQAHVSVTILRADEYDAKQRRLQVLIVWLVPLIGALGCHAFLRNQRAPGPRPDRGFVPQDPNGEPWGKEDA